MKKKQIIFLLTILVCNTGYSKLLNKIAGAINDKIFTSDEINRIRKTVGARREVSPFIYKKSKYSNQEVLRLQFHAFIIRDSLALQGINVSDDAVESRINETEKRLGLSRKDLLRFLQSKNITFNEYFELIREATEYNQFTRRIIAPLINITEQEIKNYYYNLNKKNKTISFKYSIVDYFIPQAEYNKRTSYQSRIKEYRNTRILPNSLRKLEVNEINDILGENLPPQINNILRRTNEGDITKAISKDGYVHFFYVDKKDLTESQNFTRDKQKIYQALFIKRSQDLSTSWLAKESLKYYILENI